MFATAIEVQYNGCYLIDVDVSNEINLIQEFIKSKEVKPDVAGVEVSILILILLHLLGVFMAMSYMILIYTPNIVGLIEENQFSHIWVTYLMKGMISPLASKL